MTLESYLHSEPMPHHPPDEPGDLLEKGLQLAALFHRDQLRKITGIPYLVHPLAVAIILAQAGCSEDILVAGLLHDVIEDTNCTIKELEPIFPADILGWVVDLSEVKPKPEGTILNWRARKEEHLSRIKTAPWQAQAVYMADKIHNLRSIHHDQLAGHDVWSHFVAGKDQAAWYYRTALSVVDQQHPLVANLAGMLEKIIPRVFD